MRGRTNFWPLPLTRLLLYVKEIVIPVVKPIEGVENIIVPSFNMGIIVFLAADFKVPLIISTDNRHNASKSTIAPAERLSSHKVGEDFLVAHRLL